MTTLLLNADAQPLSLLPLSTLAWEEAVKAYYVGKVDIIKHYDDREIRSVNMSMKMPSIVMLRRFHRRPNIARFSRRNMYIRDNHRCQYCGERLSPRDLTIDHVHPRCLGGDTSWENCTTACFSCNTHKSNKLIKPITTPIHPTWYYINNRSKFFTITIPDLAWQEYLQWPEELVTVDSRIIQIEQRLH